MRRRRRGGGEEEKREEEEEWGGEEEEEEKKKKKEKKKNEEEEECKKFHDRLIEAHLTYPSGVVWWTQCIAQSQELQQEIERCCAAALMAACHLLTAINCATKPNSGHETATPDLPSPTDDADAWNAFTHCVFLGKPVFTGRNDVTLQETWIFISTAVRAWNLGSIYHFREIRGIN